MNNVVRSYKAARLPLVTQRVTSNNRALGDASGTFELLAMLPSLGSCSLRGSRLP